MEYIVRFTVEHSICIEAGSQEQALERAEGYELGYWDTEASEWKAEAQC